MLNHQKIQNPNLHLKLMIEVDPAGELDPLYAFKTGRDDEAVVVNPRD